MKALIDSDLVAFRCAASCQKQGVLTEDFGVATSRANNLLVSILEATGATDRQLYLSGGENFRKKINPLYKANRTDQPRPEYLEPLREWLVTEWGATVTDGIEADDAMGIAQSVSPSGETVICSLDKDMLQVPGHHYSWEIQGTGSTGIPWKKEAKSSHVSVQQGLFNFYWQLVMGDAADNVPGYDGKMRAKVPKFLEPHYENMACMETEQELFEYVLELYQLPVLDLLTNGACLWIQRTKGDNWLPRGKQLLMNTPLERSITVEPGQLDDLIHSSLQLFEQELDVGNQSMTA